MFDVQVKITGLDELADQLAGAPQIVVQEIESTMSASLIAIDSEIRPRTPVGATGDLRRSWEHVISRPAELEFVGEFTPQALYAAYVETGRAPGDMPPPSALEYWAVRVGAVLPDETPTQAGWRLAKSIAKKGTQENAPHMVRDGWKAAQARVEDLWRGVGTRLAAKLLGRT